MPTLRIIYLSDEQSNDDGVTDARNTKTAAAPPGASSIAVGVAEQPELLIVDASAPRNFSLYNKPEHNGHEEQQDGDDYIDAFLREAIHEVNTNFASHDDERNQFHQETVLSDEEDCTKNDSSSSEHLDDLRVRAVQIQSGTNTRKMPFDKRFDEIMAFKAKHGHCDVPHTDEYLSLARWCNSLKNAHKKIQNNQKPRVNLSDDQIQCLNNVGFKWCLQRRRSEEGFNKRFSDLMAFKAKHGHWNVPYQNSNLGMWCSRLRCSYKKIQNNQKPKLELSDEQIRRLSDAGFNLCPQRGAFDERFNELMAFKAKHGNCNVHRTDEYAEYASLSKWCTATRGSYKKIQHNQKPNINVSDEHIQRLNNAGFKWCLPRR